MNSILMRTKRPAGRSGLPARAALIVAIAATLAGLTTTALAESAWVRLAKSVAARGEESPQQSTPVGVPDSAMPAVGDELGDATQAYAPSGQPGIPQSIDPSAPGSVNFGKQLDLGQESEDEGATSATNLINKPDIRRLMGDNPRFVYDPKGLQDPMLVPWVRNAAIFQELSARAEASLKANELDNAADLFKRILDLNDVRFYSLAVSKLNEIAGLKNERALSALSAQNAAYDVPAELPSWVTENTTAVIVSPSEEICLVGEYTLSVGDSLPNYPEIKVAGIDRDMVRYQIKSKTYEVELVER
jgi:hypothetical protein